MGPIPSKNKSGKKIFKLINATLNDKYDLGQTTWQMMHKWQNHNNAKQTDNSALCSAIWANIYGAH